MPARHPEAAASRCFAAVLSFCIAAAMTGGASGAARRDSESAFATFSIRPGDIAIGSDGNLWFPEVGTNRVGRLTTSGLLAEFAVSGASTLGRAIVAGPDGKLWVVGFAPDASTHVWTVTTSGLSSQVGTLSDRPPVIGFLPSGMAVGPDRNVWITNISEIVRLSPAGAVAHFPTPDGGIASSITAGPDGNLWLVDSVGPFVARRQGLCRMSTKGVIEQVSTETKQAVSAPSSIIAGPDGNLWFADNGFSEVVRVSPRSLARANFAFVGAFALAAGPDGNIWVTVPGRRTIARLTPDGASTEFELPTPLSIPSGIAAGPDGNLWFTEPDNGAIGQITPGGEVKEYAVGSAIPVPVRAPRSPRTVGPH
jgi:streptogramin lyase